MKRHYVISLDSSNSSCGGDIAENRFYFKSNTTGLQACRWSIKRNYSFHFQMKQFNNFGESNFLCWSSNEPISGRTERENGCWNSKMKPSTVYSYHINENMQLMFLASGNKSGAEFDIVIRESGRCLRLKKLFFKLLS